MRKHAATLKVSKSEVVLSALAQYLDSASDVPMAMIENRVSEIEARLMQMWKFAPKCSLHFFTVETALKAVSTGIRILA